MSLRWVPEQSGKLSVFERLYDDLRRNDGNHFVSFLWDRRNVEVANSGFFHLKGSFGEVCLCFQAR
ncbi:MAG: hypothetical protein ACE5FZ_06400 [Nitrospiria bacterium]